MGANIFNLYCSPLQEVVPKDLELSGFADDHSIRKHFKAGSKQQELNTKTTTELYMLNIKQWMDTVRLKMNPSKMEFIYFSRKPQLRKCLVDDLNIAGDLVVRPHSNKYLVAHLDEQLNFKLHATEKCQAAMFNYFKIRSIRHLLDTTTTARLCLCLYVSHLDYCNSLLYGLPEITINKLQ